MAAAVWVAVTGWAAAVTAVVGSVAEGLAVEEVEKSCSFQTTFGRCIPNMSCIGLREH